MPTKNLERILIPLGLVVEENRRAKNLSQAALGRLCGMDKSCINRIEKGKSNITLATLCKISLALEISIAVLMQQ